MSYVHTFFAQRCPRCKKRTNVLILGICPNCSNIENRIKSPNKKNDSFTSFDLMSEIKKLVEKEKEK